jgi:8-amino-7-oxononanoate synthase
MLADLDERGLRRRRRSVHRLAHDTAEIELDGTRCIDFCSNDYLGLSAHPRVTAALIDTAREHGVGARASHLITGHQHGHDALEEALAEHTGRERALLFSTGYMANLGLATALVQKGGLVLGDALNHASLIDAGRIVRANLDWYPHGDAGALEEALAARAPGPALVLTDGVFSMDGDLAPLPALAGACRRHGALLAVDDAHGFGVLGASGAGTLEHFGLTAGDVPALVGTLGKAFGSFGAFVAGDADLIETLVQRARTYIYTTALPVAVAAATLAALEVAAAESWRRVRVLALAQRFRRLAAEAGLPLAPSETPIQPVLLGGADDAVEASRRLLERGYFVAAIRPPTVPAGTSRLRVAFSAAHRDTDLDGFIAALADVIPRA